MKEFDENEVTKRIRESLPEEAAHTYSDDDLLNIVDMIWDYYEMNGLLDIDTADDEEEDLDLQTELVDYCKRMLKKDKDCKINPEYLEAIVNAELDYEDSLDND